MACLTVVLPAKTKLNKVQGFHDWIDMTPQKDWSIVPVLDTLARNTLIALLKGVTGS